MSLTGSIAGGAIGAVGSIFGGIAASKAMKGVKRRLNARESENEAWYNRRYNEDGTMRADAQAILRRTEESIRNRNRQSAGTRAVMGGTEESVAATRDANSDAMANAVTNIAVNAEARKDAVEGRYLDRDAAIESQLNNMEVGRANAIAEAVKGVSAAGAGIATGLDEYYEEKKG